MMHTAHPDIATDGLADGCPRCEEIAANPVTQLDSEQILRLVLDQDYRSTLDRVAAAKIRAILAEAAYVSAILEGHG